MTHPYTGRHLGENAFFEGKYPGTSLYAKFKTGDHGYFTEMDIDLPPNKPKGHLRIILVGGGAAQGFGAAKPSQMLYKQLEKQLAKQLTPFGIRRVEIVNMAMLNHRTYQNARALNYWGHKMAPDAIVFLTGADDFLASEKMKSNAWVDIYKYNLRIVRTRPSDDPQWFKSLRKLLPGIFDRTELGGIVRAKLLNRKEKAKLYYNNSKDRYTEGHGTTSYISYFDLRKDRAAVSKTHSFNLHKIRNSVVNRVTITEFVRSLQYVKRDFCGIPIVVAYQPIDWKSFTLKMSPEYNYFIRITQNQLSNYVNSSWQFINLHDSLAGDIKALNKPLYFGHFLTPALQEKAARNLALHIKKVLTKDNQLNLEHSYDPNKNVCLSSKQG